MTPTLAGRIQTRLVLLATAGLAWTLLVTPALPGVDDVGTGYGMTSRVLVLVGLVGLGWELAYHGIQQLRWEKDWPTGVALLVGIPEGVVAWWLTVALDLGLPGAAFVVHFGTTWIVVWAVASGPIRIVAPRWRFRGGRLL